MFFLRVFHLRASEITLSHQNLAVLVGTYVFFRNVSLHQVSHRKNWQETRYFGKNHSNNFVMNKAT